MRATDERYDRYAASLSLLQPAQGGARGDAALRRRVNATLCLVLALVIGFAGTWRALGRNTAAVLRHA